MLLDRFGVRAVDDEEGGAGVSQRASVRSGEHEAVEIAVAVPGQVSGEFVSGERRKGDRSPFVGLRRAEVDGSGDCGRRLGDLDPGSFRVDASAPNRDGLTPPWTQLPVASRWYGPGGGAQSRLHPMRMYNVRT